MVEWTDIINEVLDEQAQPVAMPPRDKYGNPSDNMNIPKLGGGGGGGYSAGGRVKKIYNDLTGKTHQPQSPLKEPIQPLPNAPPRDFSVYNLPQGSGHNIGARYGSTMKWTQQYGPMNSNKRGPRGVVDTEE